LPGAFFESSANADSCLSSQSSQGLPRKVAHIGLGRGA
jgi:hypothetical protein